MGCCLELLEMRLYQVAAKVKNQHRTGDFRDTVRCHTCNGTVEHAFVKSSSSALLSDNARGAAGNFWDRKGPFNGFKDNQKNARENCKAFAGSVLSVTGASAPVKCPAWAASGTGSAFMANGRLLARHRLVMRTIHGGEGGRPFLRPLGAKLSMPVLAAP